MPQKTSVALIGFMGTGKSAVGRLLAQQMKKRFVELDNLIEQRAGKFIPDIFRDEGEIGFREREIAVIKEVAGRKNQVIACGGGVVLNWINIQRLQQNATLVHLTATPAVILKRTAVSASRPLLEAKDRPARIRELLKLRRPFYERAADIVINTSRIGVHQVVGQIIEKLGQDADFSG